MLIEQPPLLLRKLYPSALWRMDRRERAVYLTFDDGPIPEVTPWVLDLLDRYHIRATFFMVGDNIRKHPDVFRRVVEGGHRIGNHTFNHIRGFEQSAASYMRNAEEAHTIMLRGASSPETPPDPSAPSLQRFSRNLESALHPLLFRPPHGHMTWGQYALLKQRYTLVMWDLVTRDYSKKMRPPQVLANVKRYVRNGSIITFHDSLKSWNNGNLQYALPRAIDFLKSEGYAFKLL